MQEYFNISLEEYTMEEISALCGPKDAYVDLLCREFQTSFVMRGNELKIRRIDAESEGMVKLSRGTVTITDEEKLRGLSE